MGEFEHARDINANGDPRMILGDRSESVYVYPVRAQVLLLNGLLIFVGYDDRSFLT